MFEVISKIGIRKNNFLQYLFVTILSLVGGYYFLHLDFLTSYDPLVYESDGMFFSFYVKSRLDLNSIIKNDFLGFPFGSNLSSFSGGDWANFLIIKVIGLFSNDFNVVVKWYCLLSFPLVSITSFWFFKKFNFSLSLVYLGTLVFTFLPFHFLRINQAWYMMYFIVPVYIYYSIKIKDENFIYQLQSSKKTLFKNIACLIFVSSFIFYNSFFGALVILFSGIYKFALTKNKKFVFVAIFFVSIITATVFINLLPSYLNRSHGSESGFIERAPYDTETFGLKISQFFLPSPNHRSEFLSDIVHNYNEDFLVFDDMEKANAGLFTGIGFLMIIFSWFNSKNKSSNSENNELVSKTVLFLVLFATVGGLSSLQAFFITSMVRAVNRVSIFISFYSIFYLLIYLDSKSGYLTKKKLVTFILMIFCLWDQTPKLNTKKVDILNQEFSSDRLFIKSIEKNYPGIAIYQLPFLAFPEEPKLFELTSYDHFKGYLHSKNLKWSYGCFRGSECSNFFRYLEKKDILKQVNEVKKLGYRGIYIARRGFKDNGFSLEKILDRNFKKFESKDKSKIFYYIKD